MNLGDFFGHVYTQGMVLYVCVKIPLVDIRQGRIQEGGGGPGGQDPPPHFGGPPNFIKRGKKLCAKTPHFST